MTDSERDDGADECLLMVRDFLAAQPCRHGTGDHKSTPPMMYPEWIACCIVAAVEAERERAANAVLDAGGDNADYHAAAIRAAPPSS